MKAVFELSPLPAAQVVALINDFAAPTRRAAGRIAERLPDPPDQRWSITDVERAAEQLFHVFRAAPDPAAVAVRLDRILQAATVYVSAESAGDRVVRRYHIPSAGDAPAVAGALAVLEVIETVGVDRLGCCGAAGCANVFIDRSPRRNRRFCSTRCDTRERVARHRRRQREQ